MNPTGSYRMGDDVLVASRLSMELAGIAQGERVRDLQKLGLLLEAESAALAFQELMTRIQRRLWGIACE